MNDLKQKEGCPTKKDFISALKDVQAEDDETPPFFVAHFGLQALVQYSEDNADSNCEEKEDSAIAWIQTLGEHSGYQEVVQTISAELGC